jgi:hypothetical protein
MTYTRAAVGGAILWFVTISLVHIFGNGGWAGLFGGRETFRVGFLPVT